MNQHDQMREALQFAENEMRYANWGVKQPDNLARYEAYFKVKQALNRTPDTGKMVSAEDDIATLELENRMMRERNERLERENKELAEKLASLTEIKND